MDKHLFHNAAVITPTGVYPGAVLTQGRHIAAVYRGKAPQGLEAASTDCQGMYLSPGFIDIHTHGGGGFDFMDEDPQAIGKACAMHLDHGATAIVPTTLTSTRASLMNTLRRFDTVPQEEPGMPALLGLHLEGPYFSREQRGAQDERHLRNPDPREYLEAMDASQRIIRWSFAVELPGAQAFLAALRERGIAASVAHSNATCQEVMDAYDEGVVCLTHFYSGMSGVTRRNAFRVGGVIEAGYLLDDLYLEVIADGCHLPQELLRLIYKIKGPERICLVTDAMRGAGMAEGERVMLGDAKSGVPAIIEDGVAKLPDRSAFAGSVATADRLVRTFRALTGAPLHEAVRMMSLNPAQMLGISRRKGSIAVGKDADLLVFDEEIGIRHIMVRGRKVR